MEVVQLRQGSLVYTTLHHRSQKRHSQYKRLVDCLEAL